jgi:hydroxymethylpyrimidine/phosphomethylpyrimidine kinase
LQAELLPLATLITPNMDEAEVLWGKPVRNREAMAQCASELSQRYHCAVLVKGGHLLGDAAADVLCESSAFAPPFPDPTTPILHHSTASLTWFESARIPLVRTHGTGCSYSAAIATGLAHLMPLCDAIDQAKHFISHAIENYYAWHTPQGTVHALNHLAFTPITKPLL